MVAAEKGTTFNLPFLSIPCLPFTNPIKPFEGSRAFYRGALTKSHEPLSRDRAS